MGDAVRTEEFFVPEIGQSLNAIIGHPKGHHIYRGLKKKVQRAMEDAGVPLLDPFVRPVELDFYPKVIRGPSGHISKAYDCLNFGITYKIIEDQLVKMGKLTDDNRDWVYCSRNHRAELAPDMIEGIIVVVTEVEDAAAIGVQNALQLIEQSPF